MKVKATLALIYGLSALLVSPFLGWVARRVSPSYCPYEIVPVWVYFATRLSLIAVCALCVLLVPHIDSWLNRIIDSICTDIVRRGTSKR